MDRFYILFFTISIVSANNLINVEFSSTPELNQQTAYLLNKTELNINSKLYILRSLPSKCMLLFNLIDNNNTLVYLTWNQQSRNQVTNCLIELNENISLNVQINLNQTIITLENPNQVKLNVEYIFKLFNDSSYGLIKDDMVSNGIVSIVRIVYNKNDSLELRLSPENKYFQVKKFLTNFYMIRLAPSTQELFERFDTLEIGVEVLLNNFAILKQILKFKIAKVAELKIKFNPQELNLNIPENYAQTSQPYGGIFLTKLKPYITKSIFINQNSSDLAEIYEKNYIRFAIVNSSYPEEIFELNPVNGHLSIQANRVLDREEICKRLQTDKAKIWLNISVFDSKKFFKTNFILININVLDLNDNTPKYSQDKFDLELNASKLDVYQMILLNGRKYFKIFYQSAVDLDYGENSTLDYELLSVKLNEKYQDYNYFYLEKINGHLWVREDLLEKHKFDLVKLYTIEILCRDNGKPTFKHTIVKIDLKILLNFYDIYTGKPDYVDIQPIASTYYFETELDCLAQIGQLNLGKIPIRLDSGLLQLSLDHPFEKFINLSINFDGTLTICLNENYSQNKPSLKSLNYLESKFDFISGEIFNKKYKTAQIFIKFTNNNLYKFQKDFYEFKLEENEAEKSLGVLDSNCENLFDFKIASIDSNNLNEKFTLRKFKNQIEIFSMDSLDYEHQSVYEFVVVSKCNQENYLLSSQIRVNLIDLNDNKPRFLNPIYSNQLFHKRFAYQGLVNQSLIQISRISAFDLDLSEKNSKLKYAISEVKLKRGFDFLNLSLELNEHTGEIGIRYLKSNPPGEWQDVKLVELLYQIKVIAFNYLDNSSGEEISLQIFIQIIFEDNLIWQSSANQNLNQITFKSNNNLSLDLFKLEKCWMNKNQLKKNFYLNLQENVLYFEANSSSKFFQIECKLSEIDFNGQVELNSKLIVYFDLSESSSELTSSKIHIELNRSEIFQSNNFIYKFDLNAQNGEMISYQISEVNHNYLKEIFNLNALTGELTINFVSKANKELLNRVDLINLKIEILTYRIGDSNELAKVQDLNLIIQFKQIELKQNELDQIINNLKGKYFNITINFLNQTIGLKVARLCSRKNNEIEFEINLLDEIRLDSLDDQLNFNSKLFSIVEYQNQQFLTFNSAYLSDLDSKFKFKLYLVEIKVCSKSFSNKAQNVYNKKCDRVRFNLRINFDMNQEELQFAADSFYLSFLVIDGVFYSQNLENIASFKPIIELKNLIRGANFFDFSNFKFRTANNLGQLSTFNRSSLFFLEESTGLIYARDLSKINLENSLNFEIILQNSDLYQSSTVLNIQFISIKNKLNRTVLIDFEKSQSFDWSNLVKFDLLNKIDLEIFEKLYVNIKCLDLPAYLCQDMFKFNKFTDFLMLNESLARNSLAKEKINLIVDFDTDQKKLFTFEIDFSFQFKKAKRLSLIDSNIVQFINTTQRFYKLSLVNKAKLDNESYLDIIRVKNMVTNSQVLALDYRLVIDNLNNYFLEFSDVFSMEQNQLYSFDLSVREKENNLVSSSFLKTSIYLVRLNPFNSKACSFDKIKRYYNIAGLNSLKINLTIVDREENMEEISNDSIFIQRTFVLNKIESTQSNGVKKSLLQNAKLEHDFFEFNLSESDWIEANIDISILKFTIDKSALEIIKVTEYQIFAETFDWNYKKPSINLEAYYSQIKLLKSELLNNKLESRKNGYDYLIKDFNLYNCEEQSLIEFSLDKNDLPFEIEKYTGKLFYLISEDSSEFDQNAQKTFAFKIILKDLNNQKIEYSIDFSLIDDDPVVYLENLTQNIYLNEMLGSNKLVGKIDLIKSIEGNNHQNLTKIISLLSSNSTDFFMELENTGLDQNLFYLDPKTGHLFTDDFITNEKSKIFKLNVRVSGKSNEKILLFKIDVYIIVNQDKSLQKSKTKSNGLIKFINSKYSFQLNSSKFESFQLKALLFNKDEKNLRYKLLFKSSEECEINWLNGQIDCALIRNSNKKIQLTALAYDIQDQLMRNYDFAQVDIFVNHENFTSKSKSSLSLPDDKMEDLKYKLEVNSIKIGELVANVYELILNNYELDFSSEDYRVFLTGEENIKSVSFLFDLNPSNGELVLKKQIVQSSLKLKQNLKIVSIEEKQIRTVKTFNFEMEIKIISLKLDQSDQECNFKIAYEVLTNFQNEELYKIGKAISDEEKDSEYYIETFDYNKSISNKFDLIVSNVVKFKDNLDSIVFINKSNGEVFLNRTKFRQFYLFDLVFYVSQVYDHKTQSRIQCKLSVEFEKKPQQMLEYFGYKNRTIYLDLNLDVNQVKLGDILVDLKQILFDPAYQHNLNFQLDLESDFNFPFQISNGKLFLTKTISINFYQFLIKLENILKFNVRIFVKKLFLIQSPEFQLSKFCSNKKYQAENLPQNLVIKEQPRFENKFYELNLSIDDFAFDKPILKLNSFYSNKKNQQEILYSFMDTNGLLNDLQSMLYLNRYTGEVELSINDFNKFLKFCETTYQNSSLVNLVLNLKAYNKFEPLSYATSAIKIKPNCQGMYLNIRFEQPYYFAEIAENSPVGDFLTQVSISNRNKNFYNINYYFCSVNGLSQFSDLSEKDSIFKINNTTGSVSLLKELDRETQERYEYKVCAKLKNNITQKSILVETNLIVMVKDVNDNEPCIHLLANEPLQETLIELNLPILVNSPNEFLKLFQLKSSNKDSKVNNQTYFIMSTTSTSLFRIESQSGWILVDKKSLLNSKVNRQHRLKIHARDSCSAYLESKPLEIVLNTIDSNSRPEVDLYLNLSTQANTILLDLKEYFPNEYKYLILADKLMDKYFGINQAEGFLYLKKNANKSQILNLKYISEQSDFLVAKIQVNSNEEIQEKPKQLFNSLDFYLSSQTPRDSVIFDLNKYLNQTRRSEKTLNLTRVSIEDLFYLDSSLTKLLLKQSLAGLSETFIKIELSLSNSPFNLIVLNVFIVENIISSLKFSKLNYFFSHTVKAYDLESTKAVGELELTTFDSSIQNLNKIIQAEQFELSRIKCLKSISPRKSYLDLFRLENKSNIQILINNAKILDYGCKLYELKVELMLKDQGRKIGTSILVDIKNFEELKFQTLTASYQTYYDTILSSDFSINLIDLIQIKTSMNLQAYFLRSSSKLVESFSLKRGILILALNENSSNQTQKIQFELILYENSNEFKKIILNILVPSIERKFYFSKSFIQTEFLFGQKNQLNFFDFLHHVETNTNLNFLLGSGLKFSINSNDAFEVDQRFGSILLKQNLPSIYFMNFTRLLNLSACRSSDCESILILINLVSLAKEQMIHVKEYYMENKFDFKLEMTFAEFNRNLFKLNSFGDQVNKFKLYKPSLNLIKIDYSTGCVYLDSRNNDLLKLEKIFFLIIYNNSQFIEFNVKLVKKFIEIKPRDNLVIDLNHFETKITRYSNLNVASFIGKLAPLKFSKDFSCDFWKSSNKTLDFIKLSQDCDLYLLENQLSQSGEFDLKIRAYDTKQRYKSLFYDVKVNLHLVKPRIEMENQAVFFEFRFKDEGGSKLLEDVYKFLKTKFSFVLLSHKEFSVENQNVHVFVLEATSTFNSSLIKLRTFSKLIEKSFEIKVLNIFTGNQSSYKLIRQNLNSNLVPSFRNLISTNGIILNAPEEIEIFYNDSLKFENSVEFLKLNFLLFQNFNFSNEKHIRFKFDFKINDEMLKNGLIFYSQIRSSQNVLSFIACEIVADRLELKHNLNKFNDKIVFNFKLESFVWYHFDLQITDREFVADMKEWSSNEAVQMDLSQSKIVFLNNFSFRNEYFVSQIYIGGMNQTKNLGFIRNYYSDQMEVANFKLNNLNLFDKNSYKNIIGHDLYEKSFLRSNQNELELRIKQSYKEFLAMEKTIFLTKANELNSFVKGFNLSLNFFFNSNSTENSTEFIFLETKNSILMLNLETNKIEFYVFNELKAWIDYEVYDFNRFNLLVQPGLIKLSLNSIQKEFKNDDTLNLDYYDLFLSNFLIIKTQNLGCLTDFLINDLSFSTYYYQQDNSIFGLFCPPQNSILKVLDENAIDLKVVKTTLNTNSSPNPLIITIFVSSLIAFCAIVSIIVNILIRKRNTKRQINNRNQITSETNLHFADSKFNSRNPLEISLNISSENSPMSSGSSSISGLTTSHSLSRNTMQTMIINNGKQDCYLNCSTLKANQDNYFECDPIQLKNRFDKNELFNQNDLDQLRNVLNWVPSFNNYTNVLSEFEKLTNKNHICIQQIIFNSNTNFYDEYDKQTFV